MSLTINSQPSFGTLFPRADVVKFVKGSSSSITDDYKICEAIVGPKVFEKGLLRVASECVEALRKQFPGLEKTPEKLPAKLDVKSIYTKTKETEAFLEETHRFLDSLV